MTLRQRRRRARRDERQRHCAASRGSRRAPGSARPTRSWSTPAAVGASSRSTRTARRRRRRRRRHGPGHVRSRRRSRSTRRRRSISKPRSTASPTTATPPAWATRTSCSSSTIPTPRASSQHGPRLEHDERFPKRTNVEFVRGRPARRASAHAGVGAGRRRDAVVRHRRVRGRRGRAPPRARRRAASPSTSPAASSPSRLGDDDPPRWTRWRTSSTSTSTRRELAELGPVSRRRTAHRTGRQRRRLTATEVDLERRPASGRCSSAPGSARATRRSRGGIARRARAARRHRRRRPGRTSTLQRRDTPDPATYVGKGKAEELRELARGARHRPRRVRRRAHARAATQPREAVRASTSSTASR